MSTMGSFMSPEGLQALSDQRGPLIYAILFGLFLFQTGFLIGPVVPGNPIILAAGVVANPIAGSLDLGMLILVVSLGVFVGNLINYGQGRAAGPAFARNPKWAVEIDRAQTWFEARGRAAVLLATFVPFIRAFVPFVAGMGRMNLRWYVASSLVGAFAWISTWALLGYYLGNVPFVRNNLNTIVMLIVVTVGTVAIIKSIQYRRSIRPQTLD